MGAPALGSLELGSRTTAREGAPRAGQTDRGGPGPERGGTRRPPRGSRQTEPLSSRGRSPDRVELPRHALAAALVLASAATATAQTGDLNRIQKVEVRDAGAEVQVTIRSTKTPNFTTFSMMDPPRFVVDVSDAGLGGVPEEIRGGGVIQGVKNLSYGSGATSVARVMISFAVEVDPPEVVRAGNDLVVKIAKPGGVGVAARQPPPAPALATASAPEPSAAPARAREAPPAEAKSGLNAISKVELRDAGKEIVVSIRSARTPNFTTFSLLDPPRFVVDVAEAAFEHVPEEIRGGGLVQTVRNVSYRGKTGTVARVMLTFTTEVDPPEVQTAGSTLVVTIAKPRVMGVAARRAPAAAPAVAAASPPAKVAESPAAGARGDLNRIRKVEVRDAGAEVQVTIRSTRTPNFTTFSMMDPPRFVVDVSDAGLEGVPEEIRGGGIIKAVKNVSYGAGGTSVARVMIAFTVEVDPPEVVRAGDDLVVKIAKPGAVGLAARQAPAAAAVVAAAPAGAAAAQARAEAKARAEEEARAKREAEAQAKGEREAKAKAEREAAAQARAEREVRAAAEAEADRAAQARAGSPDLNVVRRVEVQEAGGELVVSIRGSRTPNFTTFSMMDPPRFVVDLSGAAFQDVPEEAKGRGVLDHVKSLSYGGEASRVARVMLVFSAEVDPPEVQVSGNELLVKISKPGGVAVAQRAPGPSPAEPAAAPEERVDPEAKARAEREERRRQKAEAKARAEEEARAKREAAAQAKAEKAAQARAEREAKAQARAEAKARAGEEARAKREAAAQAKAEKAAQASAEREAAAQARAEAKARAGEEARANREAAAQAKAEKAAQAREEREAKAQATAEARARAGEEARAKREAKAQAKVEREARAKAEREAKAQARAERKALAMAEREAGAPARAEPEAQVEALAPAAGRNEVREIGFQQLSGVSRVFVRTAHAPRFTVTENGENVIRVELANTRALRRNDTRFLDTSFFASSVSMVTPRMEGSSYVIEITLRQRVPYQQKIDGNVLSIEVEQPAGAPTGGASAASPGEERAPGSQ